MNTSLLRTPGKVLLLKVFGGLQRLPPHFFCVFVCLLFLGTCIFLYHGSHWIQSNAVRVVEHLLGARYWAKYHRHQDGSCDPSWQQRSQWNEKKKYPQNCPQSWHKQCVLRALRRNNDFYLEDLERFQGEYDAWTRTLRRSRILTGGFHGDL